MGLENKVLWVLRQMVKNPGECELVQFYPYRKGLVQMRFGDCMTNHETCVIVDYSGRGKECYYGGGEGASANFSDKINRLEGVLLGKKRDNHVCLTVRFRGRVHAMRFSDWGCTLVLDSMAESNPMSY
jgi:hypothetical protein